MAVGRFRIESVSDLHIGHDAAITEPCYWMPANTPKGKLQRELWRRWNEWTGQHHSPDWLFVVGDVIEGKCVKTGGTELALSDRYEQARSAARILAMVRPKRVVMVYGTPYHTGTDEDFECATSDALTDAGMPCEIHACPYIRVGDVTFNIRHKTGGSSVPYGVHTAPARDAVFLSLQENENGWPHADVVIRGHTHQYSFCGTAHRFAMILPTLKSAHDKYGGRQVSSPVDWGMVTWYVEGKHYTWEPNIVRIAGTMPCLIQ